MAKKSQEEKKETIIIGGEEVAIDEKSISTTISTRRLSATEFVELLSKTGKEKLWPEINGG